MGCGWWSGDCGLHADRAAATVQASDGVLLTDRVGLQTRQFLRLNQGGFVRPGLEIDMLKSLVLLGIFSSVVIAPLSAVASQAVCHVAGAVLPESITASLIRRP